MKLILLVVILGFAVPLHAQLPGLPEAKVTVRVVDENKSPIVGAKVTLGFSEAHPQWGSGKEVPVTGATDRDGKFTGSGSCPMHIGGKVELSGYYLSFLSPYDFKSAQAGRCEPWDPTLTVVLKKIIEPLPMYAKQVHIAVPVLDQPVGFDLSVGDWVKPYGTGTSSDFIFTLSRTLNSHTDYTAKLILAFTGKGDGIQAMPADPLEGKSELKLPRSAPTDDYISQWSTSLSRGSFGTTTPHVGLGYFFRVRSVLQDARIDQAMYGKIDGEISIVGFLAKQPGIAFTYYLNPSGTTNLEFDPSHDLLSNLKDDEQVQSP